MEMKCLESSELPAIGYCASWKLILYILPPKACCSKVKPSQRLSNTAWLTLNANEEKRQEWIKEKWDLGNKSRFSKWGGDHAPWGRVAGAIPGGQVIILVVGLRADSWPSLERLWVHTSRVWTKNPRFNKHPQPPGNLAADGDPPMRVHWPNFPLPRPCLLFFS